MDLTGNYMEIISLRIKDLVYKYILWFTTLKLKLSFHEKILDEIMQCSILTTYFLLDKKSNNRSLKLSLSNIVFTY